MSTDKPINILIASATEEQIIILSNSAAKNLPAGSAIIETQLNDHVALHLDDERKPNIVILISNSSEQYDLIKDAAHKLNDANIPVIIAGKITEVQKQELSRTNATFVNSDQLNQPEGILARIIDVIAQQNIDGRNP